MRLRLAIPVVLAFSLPACTSTREKEALLRNHLFTLRSSITQYTLDKQRPPQSLAQLVQAGYLREIPEDPIANTREWEIVMEDAYMRRPDPARHLGRKEHLARDFHRGHSVQ